MTPLEEKNASSTRSEGIASVLRSPGNFRWVICALLFFSTMVNYMDRQVIGILKPELTVKLGWNDTSYANIVTAFQFAYAFGYLFGGRLMDKFGVKRGLPWAAFIWSVFAAGHGLVRSVTGFSIARLGLGLAEGGNFPAAIKTVSEWFPVKERALATGIFNSASNIGAIVCPLLVPWLSLKYGWPAAFYVTGALGFVWIAFWVFLYESPETHPRLSAGERAYIAHDTKPILTLSSSATSTNTGEVWPPAPDSGGTTASAPAPTSGAPMSWASLLKYRATWAYLLAGVLAGPVWWFYLFWLPDFLKNHFHLSSIDTGTHVAVVYAISIVGSVAGGALSNQLIARGWTINKARKTALLICAVAVVPVFAASSVANSWLTVAIVGLAAAAHQGWSANLYTFVSDTMPKRAVSSVVGMGGFVGGIASMGVAQAVGLILTKTHGNYVPMFVWASTMYLLSLLCIHLLVPKIEQVKE